MTSVTQPRDAREHTIMADAFQEKFIFLPIELVRSAPIGMDIGTTAAKILYRAKSDKGHNEDPKQKYGKMRLTSFPNPTPINKIEELLMPFFLEHLDYVRSDTEIIAHVSGIHTSRLAKRFQEEFNITFTIGKELLEMVKGLEYLAKSDLESDHVFYPIPDAAVKDGTKICELFWPLWNMCGIPLTSKIMEVNTGQKVILPCVLVQFGSNTVFAEVYQNRPPKISDATWTGGRTFQGLGNMLTGEADFKKLIDMSSTGERLNVDSTANELLVESSYKNMADNPYETDDFPMSIMGKCVNKTRDSVDPADVMSSLLNMSVRAIIVQSHLIALLTNIPRVYFCGSFINHEEVRRVITREFVMRNGTFDHERPPVEFQFLRHGSHLVAIGAYLQNLQS